METAIESQSTKSNSEAPENLNSGTENEPAAAAHRPEISRQRTAADASIALKENPQHVIASKVT